MYLSNKYHHCYLYAQGRLTRRLSVAAGLAAVLAAAGILAAAPVPPPNVSAGAIQNQFQQSRRKKLPPSPATRPAVTGRKVKPAAAKPGGVKFLLRRVEFTASKFLTPKYLQSVAQPYLNKRVTFADLHHLLNTINAEYLHRGILSAEAVLPPQKIRDGILRIRLVEGKLGQVQLKPMAAKGSLLTNPKFITSRLPLEPGQIVDDAGLARAIDFFNRTTDIQLRAALQPGQQFGLTNVLLYAQEPRRATMDYQVDNYGNPATGRLEGSESVNLFSPLTLDDRFNAYSAQSQGAINYSLSYSVPVTTFGTQVGVSYANSQYTIVNGAYQSLDVKGRSNFFGANLIQPFYADTHWLVDGGLQYGDDLAHTLIGGVDLGPTTVNKFSLGLTVQGSWTRGGFSWLQTVLYANGLAPPDQATHPFIYSGTFYGYYDLLPQWYASLYSGWQYTSSNNLTPDELFQVGGEYSVRGFPTYVAAAYSGFFTQMELHWRPAAFFDAYGFYDQAYVWAPTPTYARLQGAGLGVKWSLAHLFDRFTPAHSSFGDGLTVNLWAGLPFNRVSPGQPNYQLGASLQYEISF